MAGSVRHLIHIPRSSLGATYPPDGNSWNVTENSTISPIAATKPGIVDRTDDSNVMPRSSGPPLLSAAAMPSVAPSTVPINMANAASDRLTGSRCTTLSATGMCVNHEVPRSPCRASHSQSK